jgi:formate dehydrogenase subunit gamma
MPDIEKYPPIKTINGERYFYRFDMNIRVQHFILAATVILLVLTGMPLKFSGTTWAPYLYSIFGGINVAPTVHKLVGTAMLLVFAYHIYWIIKTVSKNHLTPLKREGKLTLGRVIMVLLKQPMVPNFKDAKDIVGLMKYLFYFTNVRPDGDEYTWKEKFDYWAPFWGCMVIGLTGIIIWNKEFFTQVMPGSVINFCLIAHSDEALLAGLFLFIWHWYNVHFSTSVFPMGMVFLTGYLTEELMLEEHYDHYVRVMKEEGLEHEIKPPHGGGERPSWCDEIKRKEASRQAGLENAPISEQAQERGDLS